MAKAANTFRTFVTKERKRLKQTYKDARSRKAQIEQELQDVERELRALAAYEAAKTGKRFSESDRKRLAKTSRRGEKRALVLKVIQRNPDGLSRGDIIKRLNLKGDKSGEQSVSNILTALKKNKQVASKSGKYVAV